MFALINVNTWSLLFNAMRNEAHEHAIKGLKVQLELDYLKLSNFDDDCTEGGSKVQPCDAASHVLTAYQDEPFEENFMIKLLQYRKNFLKIINLD